MEYTTITELPIVQDPLLIAAFAGWNDAAESATAAVRFLGQQWRVKSFASIDPEPFFVFTETRPRTKLVDGLQREISWPKNEFSVRVAKPHGSQRDIILLAGVEPQLKWRTFSKEIIELCQQCSVKEIVLLGALLADVSHTWPVSLTGSASVSSQRGKLRRLGLDISRYEGPTGIVGVLTSTFAKAGFPTTSLWGTVPHYLGVSPNLKVTLALLKKLNLLYDFEADLDELGVAALKFEEQITELVSGDPEVAAYVKRLEELDPGHDADQPEGEERDIRRSSTAELPSAQTLIQALEEQLRQQQRRPIDDSRDTRDERDDPDT